MWRRGRLPRASSSCVGQDSLQSAAPVGPSGEQGGLGQPTHLYPLTPAHALLSTASAPALASGGLREMQNLRLTPDSPLESVQQQESKGLYVCVHTYI